MKLKILKQNRRKILFFNILLFIGLSQIIFAQQNGYIKGSIITSNGQPAISVSVILQGTSYGAETDINGNFNFEAPEGKYIIATNYLGFKKKTQEISIISNKTTHISFQLNEDTEQLKEVIVRGKKINKFTRNTSEYVSKISLTQIENPQVYSSISAELISSQQSYSVEQAMNNVTGVTKLWDSNGRAGTGGAFYTLRGFSTQATLRNGLAGNVTSTIDIANIERIEVLKGPSGTLFGSSLPSFGGLINRVTKKPENATFGSVMLSGGQYGFFRTAADYNTPLNEDHSLLMRLNTSYSSSGTFQDNGFKKTFAFAPSLSYKANDRLTLNLDAEVFKSKANDFQGIYLYRTPNVLGVHSPEETNLDYNLSYKSDDIFTESEVANIFANAEYKINENWMSQTNISYATNSSSGPGPFFSFAPNSLVEGDDTATGSDYLLRDVWTPTGRNRSFEFQQNFMGKFNIGTIKNKVTLGLDYYQYDNKISYLYALGNYMSLQDKFWLFDGLNLTEPLYNYYDFNQVAIDQAYASSDQKRISLSQSKTKTYSAFAVDAINISDKLSALVSFRIDHFVNEDIYSPITDIITEGYKQTEFSPKFGLVYQVVKDKVSLFGNIQNGFENVGPVTQPDESIDKLTPRQANQWEGGLKLNLLKNKFVATLSYYDISVKNNTRKEALDFTAVDGTIQTGQFTVQNGTQSSKGFETEIIANPIAGLNFILGYAYNDSKWKKSTDDLNGLRPRNSGPENMANLWATYKFSQGSLEGLGIGAGGNYSSEALIANTRAGGKFALPEYTIGNASLFYEQASYRISLAVKNFTDKKYYSGFSTISPQITRQVVADVIFRF